MAPEEVLGPLNEVEQVHAPKQLFVAGDVTLLKRRPKVAIVGSRHATEDGLRRTARLARALVERGAVVVSGLARGVDTAAHRAAMQAGGKTIAVIGTPLNQVYPRENAPLQREIAANHALVSQFPPGHPIRPANFPLRNRTMALICDASVIVEAGETSGSLSQGWEALRLGRALFLMASIVERPGLTWPKKMMEYGAEILRDPEELLEVLPLGDELPAVSF
ncbi:MAG: DNA-protecting protein DprA [Acidobacteria bacterium]|nr:DNA-protecting protein DprA [Acidobacteriota bacterium]